MLRLTIFQTVFAVSEPRDEHACKDEYNPFKQANFLSCSKTLFDSSVIWFGWVWSECGFWCMWTFPSRWTLLFLFEFHFILIITYISCMFLFKGHREEIFNAPPHHVIKSSYFIVSFTYIALFTLLHCFKATLQEKNWKKITENLCYEV